MISGPFIIYSVDPFNTYIYIYVNISVLYIFNGIQTEKLRIMHSALVIQFRIFKVRISTLQIIVKQS